MSLPFRIAIVITVAVVLCTATFVLVPLLRTGAGDIPEVEIADGDLEPDGEADADDIKLDLSEWESRLAHSGGSQPRTVAERDKAAFEVGEMCREVEEIVQRFRSTPEERQAVIDECEEGRELVRLIAELSVSSIETMSPEELEEERENFERDYRAQLDYLQTGRLQRMLKTPEEQEVIGSTIETVQDFLERIDEAMRSAGY